MAAEWLWTAGLKQQTKKTHHKTTLLLIILKCISTLVIFFNNKSFTFYYLNQTHLNGLPMSITVKHSSIWKLLTHAFWKGTQEVHNWEGLFLHRITEGFNVSLCTKELTGMLIVHGQHALGKCSHFITHFQIW